MENSKNQSFVLNLAQASLTSQTCKQLLRREVRTREEFEDGFHVGDEDDECMPHGSDAHA